MFIGKRMTKILVSVLITLGPLCLLLIPVVVNVSLMRDIRPYLWPAAIAGVGALNALLLRRLWLSRAAAAPADAGSGGIWDRLGNDVARPPAMFILTLVVYAVLASGIIVPALPFTGDEPHYLLNTQSLLSDGDLNLKDNYERQDYLKYYPGPLTPHAYEGRRGKDALYSIHFPALPVLLIPSYFLGQWASDLVAGEELKRAVLVFAVRLTLCLFAALLSIAFYRLALDISADRKAAFIAWLFFSFTLPMLPYSQAIYPEVPAALVLLLVFRQIVVRKDVRPRILVLSGIGLGLLPWFGVKYIFHLILFSAIALVILWRSCRMSGRRMAAFAIPLVILGGLFFLFLWTRYGMISLPTIYSGTDPETHRSLSFYLNGRLELAAAKVFGLVFDQRAGILPFAPIYALAVAGAILLRRAKPAISRILLLILAFSAAFLSLTRFWQGYSPPARHGIPVFWALALFLVPIFQLKGDRARRIAIVLSLLSFAVSAAALANPRLLYYEGLATRASLEDPANKILSSLSNAFVDFRKWAPSLSGRTAINWTPVLVWTGAIAILTIFVLKPRTRTSSGRLSLSLVRELVVVLGLILLVLVYAFFNVRTDRGFPLGPPNCFVYLQDSRSYDQEDGGFWIRGRGTTEWIVASPEPLARLEATISSPTAIPVEIRTARTRTKKIIGPQGEKISWNAPAGFRLKGRTYYALRITTRGGFVPRRQDPSSSDSRFLGVFVKLSSSPP